MEDSVIFGRVALAAGLITQAQLDECLHLMEAHGPDASLQDLLLGKGYLSSAQVDMLVQVQAEGGASSAARAPAGVEAKTPPPEAGTDLQLFGKLVVENELATEPQVRECLREQAKLEREGQSKQLGELLVEKGYVSPDAIQRLLEQQGKMILRCEGCSTRYNVTNLRPNQVVNCPRCGGRLVRPQRLRKISVAAQIHERGLSDTLLGQMIGGCRLLERLGRGGMGTVYKGKHIGLNKYMAVKILPPSSAQNKAMIDRFVREARAAAKLEHRNIVQVHNVGQDKGYSFILLQFIDGQSLKELVVSSPFLTMEHRLDILEQVVRGLHEAHRHGVIHRDVKPDNIMITRNGVVKISDFGLARDLHTAPGILDKQVCGTPYYMSPEQWQGKESDARTDLYQLGVVFYWLLAGRLPFEERDISTLQRLHTSARPPNPKKFNKDIPEAYIAILGKMMARSVKARYQSAKELLDDIRRIKEGHEPHAATASGKKVACPFCEALNPAGKRKCSVCGEYLQKKDDVLLLDNEFQCPRCGTVVTVGDEACSKCGAYFCLHCKKRQATASGYCRTCAPATQQPRSRARPRGRRSSTRRRR